MQTDKIVMQTETRKGKERSTDRFKQKNKRDVMMCVCVCE